MDADINADILTYKLRLKSLFDFLVCIYSGLTSQRLFVQATKLKGTVQKTALFVLRAPVNVHC